MPDKLEPLRPNADLVRRVYESAWSLVLALRNGDADDRELADALAAACHAYAIRKAGHAGKALAP